jgi:hypothetical protein
MKRIVIGCLAFFLFAGISLAAQPAGQEMKQAGQNIEDAGKGVAHAIRRFSPLVFSKRTSRTPLYASKAVSAIG